MVRRLRLVPLLFTSCLALGLGMSRFCVVWRLDLYFITCYLFASSPLIALMYDFLPSEFLCGIFDVLDCRKIVFVLLHRGDPRYVVEGDNFETEVLVVPDFFDLFEERI